MKHRLQHARWCVRPATTPRTRHGRCPGWVAVRPRPLMTCLNALVALTVRLSSGSLSRQKRHQALGMSSHCLMAGDSDRLLPLPSSPF
ncbi:hypothetical protein BJX68DRAFT_234169 [Aspergillus pseudodeflectus]|uniref:Uncharacterized protein n=1 Tax=Aspergillus pseudodeflectus TaxID=176178 RepID=A0ABR4KLP7_9EURO